MEKLKKVQEGKVIRISNENYKRLKSLKREMTFDEAIETLVDLGESMNNEQPYFAVENKLYADIAEARGEAIISAAKKKQAPNMPAILIKVGEDDGRL